MRGTPDGSPTVALVVIFRGTALENFLRYIGMIGGETSRHASATDGIRRTVVVGSVHGGPGIQVLEDDGGGVLTTSVIGTLGVCVTIVLTMAALLIGLPTTQVFTVTTGGDPPIAEYIVCGQALATIGDRSRHSQLGRECESMGFYVGTAVSFEERPTMGLLVYVGDRSLCTIGGGICIPTTCIITFSFVGRGGGIVTTFGNQYQMTCMQW